MFQVPNATVIRGESLAVLQGMSDSSMDAILTDPPYSTGGVFASQRQRSTGDKYQSTGVARSKMDFEGDNRDQRSFLAWATLWIAQCYRVARSGAVFMAFIDWRQLPVMVDAVQAGGFTWRHIVVWDKPAARPLLGDFKRQCEYIVVGVKGKYRPWSKQCLPGVYRYQIVPATKRHHQTEKPVDLVEDLLKVVPPDGAVLDPFAGSGTTGVACLKQGRRFVGVEMSEHYYQVACARLQEAAEA